MILNFRFHRSYFYISKDFLIYKKILEIMKFNGMNFFFVIFSTFFFARVDVSRDNNNNNTVKSSFRITLRNLVYAIKSFTSI